MEIKPLKVKRVSRGWYVALGSRYDYEFFNEDGWQLMVYRAGTLKVTTTEAHGEAVYAVTLVTKGQAVDWANAIEDGTQRIIEFGADDPDAGFQGGYS